MYKKLLCSDLSLPTPMHAVAYGGDQTKKTYSLQQM